MRKSLLSKYVYIAIITIFYGIDDEDLKRFMTIQITSPHMEKNGKTTRTDPIPTTHPKITCPTV